MSLFILPFPIAADGFLYNLYSSKSVELSLLRSYFYENNIMCLF